MLRHVNDGLYWDNKRLGDMVQIDDGTYQFFPNKEALGGYWPSYLLFAIADKLDELNADWLDKL